jgi:hypothetical protein
MREHESATSLAPTNNALHLTKRVGVPAWHEGGKTNAANWAERQVVEGSLTLRLCHSNRKRARLRPPRETPKRVYA